jgi:hypothetical protein
MEDHDDGSTSPKGHPVEPVVIEGDGTSFLNKDFGSILFVLVFAATILFALVAASAEVLGIPL